MNDHNNIRRALANEGLELPADQPVPSKLIDDLSDVPATPEECNDPEIKWPLRRVGAGPYHVRFPHKWTDARGRDHPGAAHIFCRQRLVSDRLHGREACHVARWLNEAYAMGRSEASKGAEQ